MKILIAIFLIVLSLQIVSPAYAFDINSLFKGQQTEKSNQSNDIQNLVCQFLSFLCPEKKEETKPNSNQPSSSPTAQNPVTNQPTAAPSPEIYNGISSITNIVKKLWGDNPPPSWGGISGTGKIPVPGNDQKSTPTGGSSNSNSSGGTSGVIQSCVGSTTTSCAYSCANNQAACKTRGCYCVKNGPGAGADCPNFIELSKNKQFGAALTECTGQPASNDNTNSPTAPPPAGSTYISQCGAEGDFGTCQSFCEANTGTCQKRLKECQAGSTGDDCETFTAGYNYCCVENKADCSSRSPKLAQAFCGTSPTSVINPAAKSPLEQSCETETTDTCQEIFATCSLPENRNQTLGCIGLENDCVKPENSAFCKAKGY